MKQREHISGIQQVGIGVTDACASSRLYRDLFGLRALVFDDTSEASLMARFTGGSAHSRRALLTLNMRGGGGFELWQYTARTPRSPMCAPRFGDLGITAVTMNCADEKTARAFLSEQGLFTVGPILSDPSGEAFFMVHDQQGNRFQVMRVEECFSETPHPLGGVGGVVIGVSDMERALPFYRDLLGIRETAYDLTDEAFDDGDAPIGRYRRVLLRKRSTGQGAFGRLLGPVRIELVQALDRSRTHVFKDRWWGELGFIHLCLDVLDMDGLKAHAEALGVQFAVDSQDTFAMGSAGGRFCYVQDPDGTLIELVETHRVPILKKWGWYLDLKKRDRYAPLPDWMVRLLALNKVK